MSCRCGMDESVAFLTAVAVGTTLLPVVWSVCDRHAAMLRLLPRGLPDQPPNACAVDDITFLSQVARAVSAGATAAQAVMQAPASSPAVARAQDQLRSGAPVLAALEGDSPELRTLAACLHHGVLSVGAIEHAVALARNERQLQADIDTAMALARRSALVLTSVPFALLAVASLVSASVRSSLATPPVAAAVIVGTVLNRAGSAWMSRTARSVTSAHLQTDRSLAVASAVAAHLRAGGTVVSAFERLAAHDPACAEVNVLLARGAPLRESLAPLSGPCPSLVHALLACHTDGLPVAPAVDAVIADASAARTAAVRETVAALPARGTTPLVLLVLPSFLLLAVAPLALAALRGLQIPHL